MEYFSISSWEKLIRNFPSELHRLQCFHHSLSSVFYIVKRENLPFSTKNVPLPDKIHLPVSNTRPSKTVKAEFYELLNFPQNFSTAACEIRLGSKILTYISYTFLKSIIMSKVRGRKVTLNFCITALLLQNFDHWRFNFDKSGSLIFYYILFSCFIAIFVTSNKIGFVFAIISLEFIYLHSEEIRIYCL